MSEDTFTHVAGHAVSTKNETVVTHVDNDGAKSDYPDLAKKLEQHSEDISTVVEWLSIMKEWVPAQVGDIQASILKLDDRVKELEKPKEPMQVLAGASKPEISQNDLKALVKHLGDKHDELTKNTDTQLCLVYKDTQDSHDALREMITGRTKMVENYVNDHVEYKKVLNWTIGGLYIIMGAMAAYGVYYVQLH